MYEAGQGARVSEALRRRYYVRTKYNRVDKAN